MSVMYEVPPVTVLEPAMRALDTDLNRVVNAWPTLLGPIRAEMIALVGALCALGAAAG